MGALSKTSAVENVKIFRISKPDSQFEDQKY